MRGLDQDLLSLGCELDLDLISDNYVFGCFTIRPSKAAARRDDPNLRTVLSCTPEPPRSVVIGCRRGGSIQAMEGFLNVLKAVDQD